MTQDEAQAHEQQKAQEAEAARVAAAAERERRPEIGAGLFSNGNDTRSVDFLRESLGAAGTTGGNDDDGDDEE